MATRSRIGLQIQGGIVSVYHHWDGYPEYLGVHLVNNYKGEGEIRELIDGGDMSCIDSDSDWDLKKVEPHVQYYSHRGEDCPPQFAETITEFYEQCKNCGAEYAYLFVDGEWFCYDTFHCIGNVCDIPEKVTV